MIKSLNFQDCSIGKYVPIAARELTLAVHVIKKRDNYSADALNYKNPLHFHLSLAKALGSQVQGSHYCNLI